MTKSFCMSWPRNVSPVYSTNSQHTPMVIEKQNATSAMKNGDSLRPCALRLSR